MCVWVYVYVCVYMCVCVCVRACVCVCMCVCCDEGWITVAKPPAIVLFLCLPKFHSCNFCSCPVMKWRRGGGGGGGGGAQFMQFIVVTRQCAMSTVMLRSILEFPRVDQ